METVKADRSEVGKAVSIFFDGPKEVRILKTAHNATMSGVFDDPAKLIDEIIWDKAQVQQRSVYWTLQRIDPSKCKVTNAIHPNVGNTTQDEDVIEYRWLLADCDPVKDGDSATDAEKMASLDVALLVFSLFDNIGYCPVLVDSGNGYHVLVPLEIPNVDRANELVRDVLRALDAHFGITDARNSLGFSALYPVNVDKGVFNPARITKIPGTVARKGVDSIDRPHRLAHIEYAPLITKRMGRTFFELLLDELVEKLPAEKAADFRTKTTPHGPADDSYMQIVLGETHLFLDQRKIRAFEKPHGADILLVMRCPGADKHDSGSSGPTEATLVVKSNGDLRFDCKHSSCPLHSYANDTVPIQKFLDFLDPLREFPWTLPPIEAQTTEYGVEGVKKVVAGAVADAINTQRGLTFTKPKVPGKKGEYIFAPVFPLFGEKIDGWFPRSRVSLIAGPSGVGKTSFMFPALEAQMKHGDYLGHKSFGLPPLGLTIDEANLTVMKSSTI